MTEKRLPIINLQQCDLCGACVTGCSEDALVMTENGPAFTQPILCTYCTECENLCLVGAIRAPLSVKWFASQ